MIINYLRKCQLEPGIQYTFNMLFRTQWVVFLFLLAKNWYRLRWSERYAGRATTSNIIMSFKQEAVPKLVQLIFYFLLRVVIERELLTYCNPTYISKTLLSHVRRIPRTQLPLILMCIEYDLSFSIYLIPFLNIVLSYSISMNISSFSSLFLTLSHSLSLSFLLGLLSLSVLSIFLSLSLIFCSSCFMCVIRLSCISYREAHIKHQRQQSRTLLIFLLQYLPQFWFFNYHSDTKKYCSDKFILRQMQSSLHLHLSCKFEKKNFWNFVLN
jgi:hypothetical protein